jgi:hypothetical protein
MPPGYDGDASSGKSVVRASSRVSRYSRTVTILPPHCRDETWAIAYMDVDLSSDLDALHPLVAPLLSGPGDVRFALSMWLRNGTSPAEIAIEPRPPATVTTCHHVVVERL